MNYLIVLILTILIEFLIYLLFIRKNILNLFLFSVLINSFTNPIANFAYDYINFFIIEAAAILVEIFLIKALLKISYKKAILISIIANVVSASLGFVLLLFLQKVF